MTVISCNLFTLIKCLNFASTQSVQLKIKIMWAGRQKALRNNRNIQLVKDKDSWVCTLMKEAETERMHLMTFIEIAKPNLKDK